MFYMKIKLQQQILTLGLKIYVSVNFVVYVLMERTKKARKVPEIIYKSAKNHLGFCNWPSTAKYIKFLFLKKELKDSFQQRDL